MLRHVGDFNVRNVSSTQRGSHVHASGQGIGRSSSAGRSCHRFGPTRSSAPARTSPRHPHDGRGHAVATPHVRKSKSDSHHGERLSGSPAYVTPHRYRAEPRRSRTAVHSPRDSRAPSASAGRDASRRLNSGRSIATAGHHINSTAVLSSREMPSNKTILMPYQDDDQQIKHGENN